MSISKLLTVALVVGMLQVSLPAGAQEVKISHGFLFFAGEKYTMDEKTYGISEDGHELSEVLKDNAAALAKYKSYKAWHTTAYVMLGASLASIVFGGVYYGFKKDMEESLGSSAGIVSFAIGGGFLALSLTFEFISYGSISGAAEVYNKGLIEEGPGSSAQKDQPLVPRVALGPGALSLTWKF